MAYYKAFEKGLICRGKQYAENTIFEEQGADRCCTEGVMHFCKEPFDTLKYYPLVDGNGDFSEFAIIEPLDDIIEESYKCASKKIRIKEKLTFSEFIKKAVAKINGKRNDGPKPSISTTSRDFARIGSSGDYARIGSSGDYARINMTGERSVASCVGYRGTIKGTKGCWIVLTEWQEVDNKMIPVCVKCGQIDGKILKENVFYTLKNGEFVEEEEDQ